MWPIFTFTYYYISIAHHNFSTGSAFGLSIISLNSTLDALLPETQVFYLKLIINYLKLKN